MKTKILKLSLAVILATSTLYAFGGHKGFDNCDNMRGGMPYASSSHFQNDSMKNMMVTLSDMELSTVQWKAIRKVMFDLKEQKFENLKKNNPIVLIDKEGNFDKDEFVKDRTTLSKEMIETQSEAMEKVLNILDESQRKYLASKLNI